MLTPIGKPVSQPEKPSFLDKHVEALVTSEAIPTGRIAILRANPDGAGQGYCEVCGKELRYDPQASWERLRRVACAGPCAKEAFPVRNVMVAPPRPENEVEDIEDDEPEDRPGPEGPQDPTPPGEDDLDLDVIDLDIPEEKAPSKKVQSVATVSVKPVKVKPAKPEKSVKRGPCPHCGGKARGKGWAHNQVNGGYCPKSTEVMYPHVLRRAGRKPRYL